MRVHTLNHQNVHTHTPTRMQHLISVHHCRGLNNHTGCHVQDPPHHALFKTTNLQLLKHNLGLQKEVCVCMPVCLKAPHLYRPSNYKCDPAELSLKGRMKELLSLITMKLVATNSCSSKQKVHQ